jgi:hypothetical protein
MDGLIDVIGTNDASGDFIVTKVQATLIIFHVHFSH